MTSNRVKSVSNKEQMYSTIFLPGRKGSGDANQRLAYTGSSPHPCAVIARLILEMVRLPNALESRELWRNQADSRVPRQSVAPRYCAVQ